jgi:hypothetical protein
MKLVRIKDIPVGVHWHYWNRDVDSNAVEVVLVEDVEGAVS